MKYFILVALCLISTVASAATIQLEVKVTSSTDGDTLKAMYYQLPMKIRLLGIDTFESRRGAKLTGQAADNGFTNVEEAYSLGTIAKTKAGALAYGVACIEYSTLTPIDAYGRYLAKVWISPCLEKNNSPALQEILVSEGLAKVDYRYAADDFFVKLIAIETTAKSKKLGIWKYYK